MLGGKLGWLVLEYAFHLEVDSNLTVIYFLLALNGEEGPFRDPGSV